MLQDPGPLTYESDALPIALRGPNLAQGTQKRWLFKLVGWLVVLGLAAL